MVSKPHFSSPIRLDSLKHSTPAIDSPFDVGQLTCKIPKCKIGSDTLVGYSVHVFVGD